MKRGARLLLATTLLYAAPPQAVARAFDDALAAIESCLEQHQSDAWRCADAASAYCGARPDTECRAFEIAVWRALAQDAGARLAARFDGEADAGFVTDAGADLDAKQSEKCERAQRDAGGAEAEIAEWTCRRDALARRASALWLIAAPR